MRIDMCEPLYELWNGASGFFVPNIFIEVQPMNYL